MAANGAMYTIAKILVFLAGLWTFHWSIDATLEKYEHEFRSETVLHLERQLATKETDGSSRPFSSLAVALQKHEDARWGVRIHKLLAHNIFTVWFFHLGKILPEKILRWTKLEPTHEQKQLEADRRFRSHSLQQSFTRAKDYLLSPKRITDSNDTELVAQIDTLIGVGIYIDKYSSGRDAVENILEEAQANGATKKVVKALEKFRAELPKESESQ
jgi:hypothetical protein